MIRRLDRYGPAIRDSLKAFLKEEAASRPSSIVWKADLLARLAPYATGGKLLRGSLVCVSYETFSGRPITERVLKAAMAIELAHSSLLVHDDIMDGDELRRGQPALHRQYQTFGETKGRPDASRFGDNMALAGGDATLLLAFKLLAEASDDSSVQRGLQRCFTDQLIETCIGQMQDVAGQSEAATPSKRMIYAMIRAKTGGYTIALPLVMGAIVAGQPVATQKRLRALGLAAGTIFQIRDDELGAIGDSKQTGKPVGADIREGKHTLIYYYLLRNCDGAERRELLGIFGDPAANSARITRVQQLIRKYQISQLLGKDIASLRKRAETAIDRLDLPATNKADFSELVRFCGQRLA